MEQPGLFVKLPVETRNTEINNLNVKNNNKYMGHYMQDEDFKTIEESLAKNPNVVKKLFFIVCFIIAPLLLSYALMNIGQ